ncbi:MAG TPA: T9SS type A sorting domain-containing protein [Bacteroidia bacterium]|nr:T9SS type A sorting domain-containing protein [Bacteroidia bacterium]
MTKTILTLSLSIFFFLAAVFSGNAQSITINAGDMPSVNDIYVVNSVTPSPAIDPVPTGANFNWDFSALVSATQNTDTFKSLFGIGSIYAAAFIGSSYGVRSAQDINFGAFTMEKIYNLFKNSASKYEGSGQGAEINSIPTPMVFNPRDVIYKFPLDFGDADSASSEFSISVSTLITYRKFRTRVNVADGWGTLSIPTGTFNVLRVKSIVTDRDSIVINSFALPVVPTVTTEYKWLGKLQGEPLLQINAGQVGVTQVLYLENPVSGIGDVNGAGSAVTVYPNPAKTELRIKNSELRIENIEIYNLLGEKFSCEVIGSREPETVINISGLTEGVYFLKIISEKKIFYGKFTIVK